MTDAAVWKQLKSAWEEGDSPDVSADTFMRLLLDHSRANEAMKLLQDSSVARESMEKACMSPVFLFELTYSSDQVRVWESLQSRESVYQFIRDGRRNVERMDWRCKALAYVVDLAIAKFGRDWIRANLVHWWRGGFFEEEEEEILLRSLGRGAVLSSAVVHELGSRAFETLERLVMRGELRPEHLVGVVLSGPRKIQGSQPGNPLAQRVGSLMHPVTLSLDILNACLSTEEEGRLRGGSGALSSNTLGPTLSDATQRLRRIGLPGMVDFAEVIEQVSAQTAARMTGDVVPTLRFPVIRFLHLRLLLDAAPLSASLPSPEQFLVPEILLHALGSESASYSPKLRVSSNAERRSRARWAESSGEAIAIMFLECSIELDLTTLVRVPEGANETPDFQVQSSCREHIAFECKGSTSWKVHLEQRKKAISQLFGEQAKPKERSSIWAPNGRAFALCLFAARNGDKGSSLLYAEDPPFPFESLFEEGWEQRARRAHFAAVLEAAQLREAADALLAGRRFDGAGGERAEYFSVGLTRDEDDILDRFVGTFLPVQEVARRLRHPDLEAASKLRIFVGVHEQIFSALSRNELPALGRQADGEADRRPIDRFGGQAWGFLPGRERDGPARGVYSTLADGSFLAVELE